MQVLDLLYVMNDQAKRIQDLMELDNLNQQELADKIGRHFSLISKYLNPKVKINRGFLLTLQDKLGWSADWIDTGIGPQKISTKKEVKQYQGQRNGKLTLSDAIVNDPEVKFYAINDLDVYQPVKFIRYSVWATFAESFDEFDFDNISDTFPVYLPGLDGPLTDDHYVFEILGDSMTPTIVERSKVLSILLDEGNIDYLNAGVYIIAYRKYLVIKRVIDNTLMVNGTLTLHSDNPMSGKTVIKREDIRFVWRVTDHVGGKIR